MNNKLVGEHLVLFIVGLEYWSASLGPACSWHSSITASVNEKCGQAAG